jgi:rubrerythrin
MLIINIFNGENKMPFDFNADDVFEIAEQIEKNGAEFYRNASQNVKDADFVTLFSGLSEMENEHFKTFSGIRSTLSAQQKSPTVFDPSDESAQYLKALADMRVFYKKQIDYSSVESILLCAIDAEKDSIVFYLGMQDIVPDKLGKERISDIINEEKKHIRLLAGKLNWLKK